MLMVLCGSGTASFERYNGFSLVTKRTPFCRIGVGRKMVRGGSRVVEIGKTLSEILVCPLSKQPLRVCEKSNSLVSDAIGVSYAIVDGIPCLVPTDGKIIETDDTNRDHQSSTSS